MAKILNTIAVTSELYNLIKNAERFICLVSPFNDMNELFRQYIETANYRGVRILFIYRNSDYKQSRMAFYDWIMSLENVYSIALSNLHSKIYISDQAAILTSQNLLDHSVRNTLETGVIFDRDSDPDCYRGLLDIVQSYTDLDRVSDSPFIRSIFSEDHEQVVESPPVVSSESQVTGVDADYYCIACGTDSCDGLFCIDCFPKWMMDPEVDVTGHYCSVCGLFINRKLRWRFPAHRSCYRWKKESIDSMVDEMASFL